MGGDRHYTRRATHGLNVLAERITDHDNNYTRFVLIGREPILVNRSPEHIKTSILVTLPEDVPGAPHQVLSAFAWRRLNLSRIESRPTKKKLGNYYFTSMSWPRQIPFCWSPPWGD